MTESTRRTSQETQPRRPRPEWVLIGLLAGAGVAALVSLAGAAEAFPAKDRDLRDAPASARASAPRPASTPRAPRGASTQALRGRSVATQLGIARSLSVSARARDSAEVASQGATDAFEQQKTRYGGPRVAAPFELAAIPSPIGAPAQAIAPGAATALPGAPDAGPTRVLPHPNQEQIEAVRNADKKAKKNRMLGILLIVLAIVLLVIALMLLGRMGKGPSKSVAAQLLPKGGGSGGPDAGSSPAADSMPPPPLESAPPAVEEQKALALGRFPANDMKAPIVPYNENGFPILPPPTSDGFNGFLSTPRGIKYFPSWSGVRPISKGPGRLSRSPGRPGRSLPGPRSTATPFSAEPPGPEGAPEGEP